MKVANKFCLPILVLSILFLFPACGSDSDTSSSSGGTEVNDDTVVEVDFLINDNKLLTESVDFLRDEVDVNESDKVLQVRVGEVVTFKDVSTPNVSDDNREWDIFADNQPDGKSSVIEYTFEQLGLQDVELFVNNKSVRKLVYVVAEGEELVERNEIAGIGDTGDTGTALIADAATTAAREEQEEQEQLAFAADERAKEAEEQRRREEEQVAAQEEAAKAAREEEARQRRLIATANTDAEKKRATEAAQAAKERAAAAQREEVAAKKRAEQAAEEKRQADLAAAQRKKDLEAAENRRIAAEKAEQEKREAEAKAREEKLAADRKRVAEEVAKREAVEKAEAERRAIELVKRKEAADQLAKKEAADELAKKKAADELAKKQQMAKTPVVTTPPVQKMTNTNSNVGSAPADFFCGSGNKPTGIRYADRCEGSEWTQQASISFSAKRFLTLTKATLHAENSGRVQFKLTYNQGGSTQTETITRSVNSGKSEVYLEELEIVMVPGITYTLTVQSTGDSKPRLENISNCGIASTGNNDLTINYKGNQVLFDLKYCY